VYSAVSATRHVLDPIRRSREGGQLPDEFHADAQRSSSVREIKFNKVLLLNRPIAPRSWVDLHAVAEKKAEE
jgi:hypothetical protein